MRHSRDFQLYWKLDFQMNGFRLEKLVDLACPRLEKQDTQLKRVKQEKKKCNGCFMTFFNWELFLYSFKDIRYGKIDSSNYYSWVLYENV